MKPELRNKILAFNRDRAEKKDKASDMDILIAALLKLPQGQIKKLFADEDVLAVLEKYGIEGGE